MARVIAHMVWTELLEQLKWGLVAVFIPMANWINKKRKDYNSLVSRVESLEIKVTSIDDKMDEDREDRRRTADKIDKIHDMLVDVKIKSEVNASKLEEK